MAGGRSVFCRYVSALYDKKAIDSSFFCAKLFTEESEQKGMLKRRSPRQIYHEHGDVCGANAGNAARLS